MYEEIDLDYNKFFNLIKYDILDIWKKNNYIDHSILSNIKCVINYYNLHELKKIKENLNNISSIKSNILYSISYKSNIYTIEYFGKKKFLPNIFLLNGLKLKLNDNNCKIYLK